MDSLEVKWMRGTIGDLAVTRVQLWRRAPETWQPPINAFRCEREICICADLAGVDKSLVDLQVEPRRVLIRGSRKPPEPNDKNGRALQMLALEIDYGPFERELILPAEVEVENARAEQDHGLLWIHLPLKK
jgi:HSP20 family protein